MIDYGLSSFTRVCTDLVKNAATELLEKRHEREDDVQRRAIARNAIFGRYLNELAQLTGEAAVIRAASLTRTLPTWAAQRVVLAIPCHIPDAASLSLFYRQLEAR